jgi:hypothetical protein
LRTQTSEHVYSEVCTKQSLFKWLHSVVVSLWVLFELTHLDGNASVVQLR